MHVFSGKNQARDGESLQRRRDAVHSAYIDTSACSEHTKATSFAWSEVLVPPELTSFLGHLKVPQHAYTRWSRVDDCRVMWGRPGLVRVSVRPRLGVTVNKCAYYCECVVNVGHESQFRAFSWPPVM